MKITSDPIGKTSIEHLTYSRYDVGYAFQSELESRLVTLDQRDVSFSEADVLAIIVPDSHMKTRVEIALNAAWERKPQVLEFPS